MMFWELSGEFGKNPYACIPEPQFVSTICVMHWLQWGKPGIIPMGKKIYSAPVHYQESYISAELLLLLCNM